MTAVDIIEVPAAEPGRSAWRRLLRDPAAIAGAAVLLVLLVALAAAPWLAPDDPLSVDTPNRLASVSADHPFGTDLLGRDVFSRILYGGRASVLAAVVATAGITILGLTLGVISGVVGGAVDTIIMRVVDVLVALPTLIVAMVVLSVLGDGTDKLIFTVVLVGWPGYARVIRGAALKLREEAYVDAARATGSSTPRIMVCHIVPNLVGPATVLTTLDVGRILLTLTALSFLGFGVQPPTPEWGAMMAEARDTFYRAPRLLIYPGVAISMLVFAVNLLGDGLRDAFDTKVGVHVPR